MGISQQQVYDTIGYPPESRREKADYYFAWADLEEEADNFQTASFFRERAQDYLTYPNGMRIAALTPEGDVRYWAWGAVAG